MPFPVAPAVFSAVSSAAKLAWFIYEKGFRSDISFDQDYAQLVNAVREFSFALTAIEDVFKNANDQVARTQVQQTIIPDLSLQSFKTIVGDFQKTLEDCRNLLDNKESYGRSHGGVATRIAWNVFAKEEVQDLRSRIIFHHTRLDQTLQPLRITLMLSLQRAMENGFQSVNQRQDEIIDRLKALQAALGLDAADPVTSTNPSPVVLPPIPDYLLATFDHQAELERDLPVSDEVRISSIMGHLAELPSTEAGMPQMSRTQIVQRYVNLMKAAWILERPNEAVSSLASASSSLTVVTLIDLKEKAAKGLSEFDSTHSIDLKPSTAEIRGQPNIHFGLWLFPPGSRPLEPEIINHSEIILMKVPLEAATATERQQLEVVGSLAQRQSLRIVTSFRDTVGRSRDRITHTLNTTMAVLQPTYAQIDAELANVQLKTSVEDQLNVTFQFRKLTDLFRFQRCLTGFEVKLDQPGLTSLKFKYRGLRALKSIEILSDHRDVVRAQIWYHSPMYEHRRSTTNGALANGSQRNSLRPAPTGSSSINQKRKSQTSSTRSQTLSIDQWAQHHAPSSLAPSRPTANGTAQEILDLEEPKVVIFLARASVKDTHPGRPRQVKNLQYFTFPLREGVVVDPSRCKCHNDDNCKDLVVTCKGTLNARLYDHKHDLTTWNLSALGQAGHRNVNSCCRDLEDINRIVITFKEAIDRQLFEEVLTKTIALYEQRRTERDRSINNVQRGDVAN